MHMLSYFIARCVILSLFHLQQAEAPNKAQIPAEEKQPIG